MTDVFTIWARHDVVDYFDWEQSDQSLLEVFLAERIARERQRGFIP